MSKASQVIVLVEDRRQHMFIWRFLERAGYGRHQIRAERLPAGKGSGEAWVRERYGENVAACRTRSARAATALVVAIDADTSNVTDRANQLAGVLANSNLPARTGDERIAHLIPRRNIETWIRCLTGHDVDEDTDYKKRNDVEIEVLIKPAAVAFFEGSRSNTVTPDHWVDSLESAIPEVRRLDRR